MRQHILSAQLSSRVQREEWGSLAGVVVAQVQRVNTALVEREGKTVGLAITGAAEAVVRMGEVQRLAQTLFL